MLFRSVVEAALAGQGIAMGRHRLIAQQLASKALVEVLPDAVLDDPRIGWWLVMPKGTLGDPASAFRAWITQTAAQDSLDRTH